MSREWDSPAEQGDFPVKNEAFTPFTRPQRQSMPLPAEDAHGSRFDVTAFPMTDETHFYLNLVRLLAILFFPLFPAFVVMKYLPPTKATTGGLFAGMQIKLAGGGAFYFILLLVCLKAVPEPPNREARAWTVTGSLALKPIDQGDAPRDALKAVTFVCLPTFQDAGHGKFILTVARQNVNGVPLWPSLQFSADKYQSAIVDTEDHGIVEIDEAHSRILIKKTVELQPLPPAQHVRTVTAENVTPL